MKQLLGMCGLISTLFINTGCTLATTDFQQSTAPPNEALINTYWKLERLDGAPIATHENFREAHLVLHKDALRLAGATGCNTLLGSYHVENERIAFGQIASTEMACPAPQMRAERDFIAALKRVTAWSVDGATLVLLGDNNEPLAVFKAVHLY